MFYNVKMLSGGQTMSQQHCFYMSSCIFRVLDSRFKLISASQYSTETHVYVGVFLLKEMNLLGDQEILNLWWNSTTNIYLKKKSVQWLIVMLQYLYLTSNCMGCFFVCLVFSVECSQYEFIYQHFTSFKKSQNHLLPLSNVCINWSYL